MDVSEPGVSCWFGSLTESSMLAAAPSADSRISILTQCRAWDQAEQMWEGTKSYRQLILFTGTLI